VSRPLLALGIVTAFAAALLSVYVAGHHFIPQEVPLDNDIQATNWGPLALSFPFFTWIGDAKGVLIEVGIFVAILLLNRGAWLFAAGATLTGGWYEVVSHLIVRPRPTTAQVLHVYEHPGASSYPSGHSMFIVTVTVVLMVCLGYRYLPRRVHPFGWALVVLVVAANGIARVYTGAHWPTDVVAGVLIATAWLAVLASVPVVWVRVVSSSRGRRRVPSALRSRSRPEARGGG
jgi:membrane-associated phospholipid phosphatase